MYQNGIGFNNSVKFNNNNNNGVASTINNNNNIVGTGNIDKHTSNNDLLSPLTSNQTPSLSKWFQNLSTGWKIFLGVATLGILPGIARLLAHQASKKSNPCQGIPYKGGIYNLNTSEGQNLNSNQLFIQKTKQNESLSLQESFSNRRLTDDEINNIVNDVVNGKRKDQELLAAFQKSPVWNDLGISQEMKDYFGEDLFNGLSLTVEDTTQKKLETIANYLQTRLDKDKGFKERNLDNLKAALVLKLKDADQDTINKLNKLAQPEKNGNFNDVNNWFQQLDLKNKNLSLQESFSNRRLTDDEINNIVNDVVNGKRKDQILLAAFRTSPVWNDLGISKEMKDYFGGDLFGSLRLVEKNTTETRLRSLAESLSHYPTNSLKDENLLKLKAALVLKLADDKESINSIASINREPDYKLDNQL